MLSRLRFFRRGLTTAVFREFGKVPERSEVFTTSKRSASKQLSTLLSVHPVALLSSDACELAPLRTVLFMCFFYLFFTFLLLFLIRVSSAMIMYDRRTLLDIGQRYTNLIQDTLSTDPAWPLEIARNNELNNDPLNNRRRRRKHRG